MSTLSERLQDAMERAGMTQAAVGRKASTFGETVSQQVVQHLASGRNTSSKHLLAIAKALDVNVEWLMTGKRLQAESGSVALKPGPAALRAGKSATATGSDAERVPVLGMAECGPDGWSMWNGDIIDTIPRPSNLVGAPRAYAVYIVGDSMEPRYYSGELAHIHPGKPVTIGAFVLVQIRPEHDGEAPKAVVKRLIKRTGSKVVLEQYNPAKKFEIKTDDIVSIHRVVGSGES
jgi:phage repressor protein C with HTH and peptisase S24 domain